MPSAARWLLSALLAVALSGCAAVHCSTGGDSDPGGCGFDFKFNTSDSPAMPGSAASSSTTTVPPPKIP